MNDNTIKVKSPDYGLVTFSMMSTRQMEVLREYEKLKKKDDDNKKNKAVNDAEIRISSSNRRY